MNEQYVFDTQEIADSAQNYITTLGGFPFTNKKASDGTPQPDSVKTLVYAEPTQRNTDGKWFFAKLTDAQTAHIPQETKDAFNAAFPHTIESYDNAWFSSDDA